MYERQTYFVFSLNFRFNQMLITTILLTLYESRGTIHKPNGLLLIPFYSSSDTMKSSEIIRSREHLENKRYRSPYLLLL